MGRRKSASVATGSADAAKLASADGAGVETEPQDLFRVNAGREVNGLPGTSKTAGHDSNPGRAHIGSNRRLLMSFDSYRTSPG